MRKSVKIGYTIEAYESTVTRYDIFAEGILLIGTCGTYEEAEKYAEELLSDEVEAMAIARELEGLR